MPRARPDHQIVSGVGGERQRLARRTVACCRETCAAVGLENGGAKLQGAFFDPRHRRDGRATIAAEHGQERAFGGDADRGRGIVDGCYVPRRTHVIGADFERDRTLRRGRQHLLHRYDRGRSALEAEPL